MEQSPRQEGPDEAQVRKAEARADEAARQAVSAARQATEKLQTISMQWTREDLEATRQLEQLTARHATMQLDTAQPAAQPPAPREEEGAARRREEASTRAAARARQRSAARKDGAAARPRAKRDPLRYAAKLVALAALLYLALNAGLRLGVAALFTRFHAQATLETPLAVPEWVLGAVNTVLPAVCLWVPFAVVRAAVRGGPLALKLSFRMPRKPALWAFLPVVLGVGLVGSVLSSLLQRGLYEATLYRPPETVQLPRGGFATFLYFIGTCAVPALLEELLVRGAMQQLLARWGAWFSIVVSSAVFTLMHGDIAQMPALFVLSVLLGLSAHGTGTLAMGVALHFAYNTMSFCFLYATQKMDGVSAVALTGYLMAGFALAAVVCTVYIRRNRVFSLLRPIPRVYDPKNRQSRAERLATTPLFVLVMAGLAARALLPLFVDLGGVML